MDFYQAVGELVLGTRMKRLSDRWFSDISRIYQAYDIQLEPSWFPIFYLLDREEKISLTEIAAQLEITHSAVSQMAGQFEKKGLIKLKKAATDKRKRVATLTAKGRELVTKARLMWEALELSVREVMLEGPHSKYLIPAFDELEESLEKVSLFERMDEQVKRLHQERIVIEETSPIPNEKTQNVFEQWERSEPYFLDNYRKLDKEHAIMYGAWVEEQLVGVIAAEVSGERTAQICLLFVPPEFRKQEIGNQLLDQMLHRLKEVDISNVMAEVERNQTMLVQFFKKHGLLLGASQDNDYRQRMENKTILLTLPT